MLNGEYNAARASGINYPMLLHNSCGLNSFAFSNRAEDAITYDRIVEAYLQIGQRGVENGGFRLICVRAMGNNNSVTASLATAPSSCAGPDRWISRSGPAGTC